MGGGVRWDVAREQRVLPLQQQKEEEEEGGVLLLLLHNETVLEDAKGVPNLGQAKVDGITWESIGGPSHDRYQKHFIDMSGHGPLLLQFQPSHATPLLRCYADLENDTCWIPASPHQAHRLG